jgi:hypothetical protein
MRNDKADFRSFTEFYPYYLAEHQSRTSRRLHFTGTLLVIVLTIFILVASVYYLAILLPICGYGFAWAGHFFFEKNRPATFKWPLYSLIGDFVMFKDMLIGRIKF